jgi:hypothetical protein
MPVSQGTAPVVAWLSLLVLVAGCGGRETAVNGRDSPDLPPLSGEDRVVYQKLESQVNTIVNDQTMRYSPLEYKYSDHLLEIIDEVERILAGKNEGEPRRFLPKLGAQEEVDHLRETVRLWEAQTGKNLRAEVDALKVDVAARKPGVAYHPEFQRKFSQVFDKFIALEVTELRERRNRAIHVAAEALLAPIRDKNPEPVRRIEEILNQPSYQLPSPATSSPRVARPERAKP